MACDVSDAEQVARLVGSDLGAPDEQSLTEDYDLPLFVCNYPKEAKAFYMKENPDDPRTYKNSDLLAPEGFGEIIGGSERETDNNLLIERLRDIGESTDSYQWYLDLRKYGSVPHSGFGLGFERAIQYATGVENIRDVIPFPKTARGTDLMCDAPAPVPDRQLRDLGIGLKK